MKVPILDRVNSGRELDISTLRPQIEPINCSECGQRLGWADTDYVADTLVLFCDSCVVDQTEEEADAEE